MDPRRVPMTTYLPRYDRRSGATTQLMATTEAPSTMVTIATARVVGEDCFVVDESAKAPSPSERR